MKQKQDEKEPGQAEPHISVGDIVIDTDDDNPSQGIVVNRPPIEAHEWELQNRNISIADDNPDYAPTDKIAMVVYQDELKRKYPHYTGGYPIKIKKLFEDRAHFYTFPRPRLKSVGSLEPKKIPISQIHGNKYHSRTFSVEGNREFINEVKERGYPKPIPLVHCTGNKSFEIISGHKRTWIAAVAGIDEIYCEVIYSPRKDVARKWARRHLHEYNAEQLHTALRKIKEDYENLNEITNK